ncbi:ABC transporter permease subunit [Paenibacillus doosanensis]|uniref:Multiple-sugar transport system permease YteP n=1 Tax=Paenibacillus konkukensis TaxID=2020716 RepID=A0ABY4RQH5_9BACL|nr:MULTISPECIES: ABC transporter permease subunit [Paenibacillus]MCS7461801.1 ABC transporter permease subunit [Paenibacillus doosanensis]UQZ83639.1 putative multiple-sugar transport system permease YteP [Paenibacillus konkukensis]
MRGAQAAAASVGQGLKKARIAAHLPFYVMILPGLVYFLIFKYVPMLGLLISFQRYDPFSGMWSSPWVGMDNFNRLFTEPDFPLLLTNTFAFACLDILFFFPAPIILALLLNESRLKTIRNTVQTIMYGPHFISWVVIVSMTMTLFSSQDGIINQWLVSAGFGKIELFTKSEWLRPMWLLQNMWQGAGWGSILYLATMASIDPSLYEAAKVDGAGRFRQIWHITLPGIRYVVIVLFILRLGHFMDIGFEHIFLLQNPLNVGVSDVFDTYVYRTGILQRDYSYSAVVGMFKSIVGLTLVLTANKLARKFGEEGVI